jgi:ketosteroid isomerase-like protein
MRRARQAVGEWRPWSRVIVVVATIACVRGGRAEQAVVSPPAAVPHREELAAEVLAADDARIAALTSGDVETLAGWLADDLRYVHSNGAVDTKESFLELVRSGRSRYAAYEPLERTVRFPAADVALDSGRARLRVETADGPIEATFHYLACWRRDVDGWRFTAWQSARPPQSPTPPAFSVTFDEPAVPSPLDPDAAFATGWRDLDEHDFEQVNCGPDTWTWRDGIVHCTGQPVGVIRTKRSLRNLELSLEWRHLTDGGNSGVFLWAPPEAFADLVPGKLPRGGIEVQILDHGYRVRYEAAGNRRGDWFSTDGDVFPVGTSTMTPFPPTSPDGSRSFPSAAHTRGSPAWNHYYVRASAGEVRLWVNGHEVSGGTRCEPAEGHLCLESEGAPVEFRRLRIRELP